MNYWTMGKPALSAALAPLPILDAARGPEIVFTEPIPKIPILLSLLIIYRGAHCVWPLPIGFEPEKK